MADTLKIRIDIERLTSNMAAAEGSTPSLDDVLAFLAECGFVDLGGAVWGCEEISLRALDQSEWKREVPRPAGRCWCGYDLCGNVSGRCSECGLGV